MTINRFEENDPRSFRVKTSSGTVYVLSVPDGEGMRQVGRFSPGGSSPGTFIMHRIDFDQKTEEDDSNFKGKILCEVQIGAPMILGIGDGERRIISDIVAEIVDTS